MSQRRVDLGSSDGTCDDNRYRGNRPDLVIEISGCFTEHLVDAWLACSKDFAECAVVENGLLRLERGGSPLA